MPGHSVLTTTASWRHELPILAGRTGRLREPAREDLDALLSLLQLADAMRFGIDGPATPESVQHLIDRAWSDRQAGLAFTYAVAPASRADVVGLVQVRQLDAAFEAAEWECTIASGSRGTGLFVEAARLVGSFAFGSVGVHRLEARVPVLNGRGNGALRKLGAFQEGVLRRSACHQGQYVDQVLWSVLKDDWGEFLMSPAPRVH